MLINAKKQKLLYCLIMGIAAILCMLFQSCSSDDDEQIIVNNSETTQLTGTVLDGPVQNAYIRFMNPDRDILFTGESNDAAKYDVQFSENTVFPIHIEMLDGNDYLTGEPVVLTLTSIAMNNYQNIANITPLTHLIYLTAQKKGDAITNDVLEESTLTIINHFGFRFPENINPFFSDIIGDNTADILISNQLVIELMKRVMGNNTANELSLICEIWAEDLKDENLDGQNISDQLEQKLSEDLSVAKVCLKTHIYRLVLFTEMFSNSISITNRTDKADMGPNLTREMLKNCMCKMGLACDESERQLNLQTINHHFISELRNSITMLESFCEKHPEHNDMLQTFESLDENLENIQADAGSEDLTRFISQLTSFYDSVSSNSDDNDLQNIFNQSLEEITIISPYTSFSENSTFKLLVNGKYASGITKDLSLDVVWKVVNSAEGFVTNIMDNSFLAVSSGDVKIEAELNNKTDCINLIIVPIHPSVISHQPKDKELDVQFDRRIEIRFSKPIKCEPDPFTISSSRLDPIDFSVKCIDDGKHIEIKPNSNFLESAFYTVTVTENLVDIAGNPIQEPYKWSFQTKNILPEVTGIIPAYTQNVSASTALTVFFSEPIECSCITDNIHLLSSANKNILGKTRSISAINSTGCTAAIFIPDENLASNEQHTLVISKNIVDLQGNSMSEDAIWKFTTDEGLPYIESHIPSASIEDIPIPKSITVTFSEPVLITKNCIVLEYNSYSIITGNVSCLGELTNACSAKFTKCNSGVVNFTPDIPYVQNTLYTVTVNPSSERYSPTIDTSVVKVRDYECIIFDEMYSWTFQTFANPELLLTPSVIMSDKPINHTILNNTGITFTFNEPMALSQYTAKVSFDNQYATTIAQGNDGYTTYALSYLFKEDTSYTITIQSLADKNGNPYQNNNGQNLIEWYFQTASVPKVIDVQPEDKSSHVPLDLKSITISLSEPVQTIPIVKLTTATETNIELLYASHIAYTQFCYTLPIALSESTQYTLIVMADSVVNKHDIQMVDNYNCSFTSVNIAPKLVDFYPGTDTSQLYPVNTVIRLTCSENVEIAEEYAFYLNENNNQVKVISHNNNGKSITFSPENHLKHKTTYCVNIHETIVKDIATLPEYLDLTGTNIEWCFNTEPGAALVYENSQITITFERDMDIASLNTNTIVLSSAQSEMYTMKMVSSDVKQIVLEPIDQLLSGKIYTITITDGVKYLDTSHFAEHSFSITGTSAPPPDDLEVKSTELKSVNFMQGTLTFLLTFSDTVSTTDVSHAYYITKNLLYIQSIDDDSKYKPEKLTQKAETIVQFDFPLDRMMSAFKLYINDKISNNGQPYTLEYKNSLDMNFSYIPKGQFLMGSPIDEKERDIDENQHLVTITQAFMMQRTEVTQSQWQSIMSNNPSYNDKGENYPVENVSWNDVQTFIRLLNEKEGTTLYQLPTEAQWEYAARAQTTTAFSNGIAVTDSIDLTEIDKIAHYSARSTQAVGQKAFNKWNLYDVHGNVMEWTADYYLDTYLEINNVDPTGPKSGSFRVIRGGSYADKASACRSANRGRTEPENRFPDLGFRIIRRIP